MAVNRIASRAAPLSRNDHQRPPVRTVQGYRDAARAIYRRYGHRVGDHLLMTLLAGLLALACLAVGGYHALRLAVLRTDPPNEAAHAVMGIGMAARFSPLGDPLPAPVWTVVFLLLGT